MIRPMTAALLSLSLAVPAFAANEAPEADKTVEERKICRTTEGISGTRIPKRKVCKTRAEWAAESDRNSSKIDRDRNDSSR